MQVNISQSLCSTFVAPASYCKFKRRLRARPIIVRPDMATRACLLLFLAAVAAARECIELTLPEKSILTDTIFNGTILKITAKNDTIDDTNRVNVLNLFDGFPKIVVPRNGTSEQCRRDSQLYMDSLERLELWALKSMYCLIYKS